MSPQRPHDSFFGGLDGSAHFLLQPTVRAAGFSGAAGVAHPDPAPQTHRPHASDAGPHLQERTRPNWQVGTPMITQYPAFLFSSLSCVNMFCPCNNTPKFVFLFSVLVNMYMYDVPNPLGRTTCNPRREDFLKEVLPRLEVLKQVTTTLGMCVAVLENKAWECTFPIDGRGV